MRTLGQYLDAWKRDSVRACTPHPIDCRCSTCLDGMFGPLDAMPSDAEEQRDAAYGDLGVPTVDPEC